MNLMTEMSWDIKHIIYVYAHFDEFIGVPSHPIFMIF